MKPFLFAILCFGALLKLKDLLGQGNDRMAKYLFIEAVLAFEASGLGVVLAEKIVGVDRGVVDAE